MKPICFLTPQFKTGGGNRVFIEIANIIAEEENVEILFPNNSKEKNTFELNEKVKVKAIGNFYSNILLKLLNLIYTLFWIRFKRSNSILIITDPLMSLFWFILPKKNLYRFIQSDDYRIFDDKLILKNDFLLKIYKKLTLLSYRSKKLKFIFNSKYVYDNYIKNSKRCDVPYRVVHPAINKDIFKEMEPKNNEVNLCIVARKHPLKGFGNFIKMWEKLEEEYKEKINKVFIISHDDLSKFKLSDKKFEVICPESDMEIAETMNRTHIFISTSWWEGFGLPPLEALACGNKLLLSDSGGINEYAVNEENCLIYPPLNIDKMLEKLKLILDKKKLDKKFIESKENTIKNFSWQKSASQLKKIIG